MFRAGLLPYRLAAASTSTSTARACAPAFQVQVNSAAKAGRALSSNGAVVVGWRAFTIRCLFASCSRTCSWYYFWYYY